MKHVPARIATACLSLALLIGAAPAGTASAQGLTEPVARAKDHLKANQKSLGLTSRDIADAVVSNQRTSLHNGVADVSFQQQLDGIDVFAGVTKVNIARDGTILGVSNRFVSDLASKARAREPRLSAAAAVLAAARELGLEGSGVPQPKEQIGGPSRKVVFGPSGLSKRDIPVRLVYLKRGNGVRLAWDLPIETDQEHYWQLQVDAVTGRVLQRKNYVLNHGYKVYPIPAESPNHAGIVPPADGRTLAFNPEAKGGLASPAGWITPGLLTTDGPNVQAQTDLDFNDVFTPGTDVKPVGTGLPTALTFSFPVDFTQNASTYREALVTNLFYWNNVNHDIHELYGFDEANFNFEGNDPVLADAQDGSGTNNANMLTLPEGVPPRMQMYLFTPPADLRVNSPFSALYNAGTAGFGQPLNETGVTGDLALVNDGAGTSTTDACEPPPWVSNVTGKIALLDRGTCEFSTKILHAQQAGAVAAVLVNIQSDDPISMSAGVDAPQVTIPSVSIGNASGNEIKAVIGSSIVNVTMRAGSQPSRDSDFDNGVITHEYGHGVSNRLAGDGVNVPFCLDGDQQAGEGWSDWWALAFTQATGTEAPAGRGIATYSLFQSTTGSGFRPFRYSTDMSINPQTYGDLTEGRLSIPHGVGTVWATAAWDMYWALVRGVPAPFNLPGHGFEPDIYNFDSGKGNTIALQLMIDGLKLGGCAPNMLTTRDAILLADTENNGGANQCHIWWAFARRGMGVNAMSDGTTLNVTEDFNLPLACQPPGPCAIPPFFTGIDRVEAPAGATCSLVVKWSAARDNCETGQIRYNLYRSTDPLFVPSAANLLAPNLTGLEYTDTSVQSGVEYFYIARAHDGLGNSEQNLARRSNRPLGGFSADPNGLTDDAGDTEQHFAGRAGQTGWTVRSSGGVGGSKVHATSASGNYPNDSCLYLESDIVHLGAGSTLSFQSAWAIEPGWDGGIVEISTEAGGFSDWTKLDDVLYPGAMAGPLGNTSCSNPGLADGERIFTGTSNGNFLGFTSELAAWANQSVRIRFVFGSDAATNDTGWLIDNISIDDVRAAQPCTTNNPPDAVDDAAATTSGTPVTVNVLANDTDAEGDTLTVTSVSDPPNGTAVRNANNTVTYTPDGSFTGSDSFTYTIGDGRGGSDTATVRVTVTAASRPDLVVSNITVNNNRNVREGDKVTIRATVSNTGNASAPASQTEFRLDAATIIGLVATPSVPAGSSVDVSVQWDTRSVKGQHVITVTADRGTVVAESNEGNNASTLTVNVQGNKTKNSSFEQSNSAGTGPDGWSGESTGGGNAAWSEGGSDGSKSAATSGNGGNAATSGSPSWKSDPIAVNPGELLTLAVSVQSTNASSAASAGLVYLGAAGQVLNSVTVLTAPLTTSGFAKLEQVVTVPAGVAQVRVKLVGFAPTDRRTSGTVRFDEVGLFGN